MNASTKNFGEICIEDEKIITFGNGIIGFPDLKHFALIYNNEKGDSSAIKWLQSMEEPNFAMPVLDPLIISTEYNPVVDDEILKPIGEFATDELLVLTTVTVPKNIEQLSVNLKAPIVINARTRQAVQLIVDGDEYPVKYFIYELLKKRKAEKAGGEQ